MSYQLVLFDIDGTLLISAGAGKRSLAGAFMELHGVEAFEGYDFIGKTDLGILEEGFSLYVGRPALPGEAAAVAGRYLQLLKAELARRKEAVIILPGIRELLEALDDAEVLVGLATGNLEGGAALKLAAVGLDQAFSFGGYGSDSKDRTRLTSLAIERAREFSGMDIPTERVLVVGDSILDVWAGHGAGAHVLAVGTGWTDEAILQAEGPEFYLDDLSATNAVLKLLKV
jgi:phosphoglycolate phosphatase